MTPGAAENHPAPPSGDLAALPDLLHGQQRAGPVRDRRLVADNPFAAIHGRVCYHPCESVCNRAHSTVNGLTLFSTVTTEFG